MEKYRASFINKKWCIECYTKEFGYVLLLKKDVLEPLTYDSKECVIEAIKNLNANNCELCL